MATKQAAHGRAVTAATAAVKGFPPDKATRSDAYRTAVADTSAAIKTFAEKTADQALSEDDVDTEVATVRTQVDARGKARTDLAAADPGNPAIAAFATLELAQDAWFKAARAHSLANKRLARVQKFVEFVETNNIAPITPYAARNWPHKPEEFWAEAYAMFLVKPADLQTQSKLLFDWFTAGKHH